jgi:hypothetical protein
MQCVWAILSTTLRSSFPHYLINGTISENSCGREIVCFGFLYLSGTFLILGRIQRSIIVNCIGIHINYLLFLLDFNENLIFTADFKKIPKYKISWKSAHWKLSRSMRWDRTDMKKLIVAIRNFAKALKINLK